MPDTDATRPPSQELRDTVALLRLRDGHVLTADESRTLADLLEELSTQAATSEAMLGELLTSLGEGGYPPAVRSALRLCRAVLAS